MPFLWFVVGGPSWISAQLQGRAVNPGNWSKRPSRSVAKQPNASSDRGPGHGSNHRGRTLPYRITY